LSLAPIARRLRCGASFARNSLRIDGPVVGGAKTLAPYCSRSIAWDYSERAAGCHWAHAVCKARRQRVARRNREFHSWAAQPFTADWPRAASLPA